MEEITLSCNINVLDEKPVRTTDEKELDICSEDEIVYQDLVFTLKEDPSKYFRPKVLKQRNGLYVVSNPLFFNAVKDAGYEEIYFDLLINGGFNPQRVIDEYGLKRVGASEPKKVVNKFLFFHKRPEISDECVSPIHIDERSNTEDYISQNCIAYNFKTGIKDLGFFESNFLESLVNRNGSLRSINGRINNSGKFSKYF